MKNNSKSVDECSCVSRLKEVILNVVSGERFSSVSELTETGQESVRVSYSPAEECPSTLLPSPYGYK